ncbi:MAG TPA: hypothetical protein ENH91_03730 [Leeuwenhoekiella sp.]|nr:hypothetical protein [Leeuwenhoekiella sp.]
MDKPLKKEGFETLKIKASVTEQFRKFSKKISRSQSMTLLLMLEFFEENGISPLETMGPRMETLESRISVLIKKRMNGMIAILKDIEKTQTKPTAGMMQAIFMAAEPPTEKPLLREKKFLDRDNTERPFHDTSRFTEKKKDDPNTDVRWKK